MTLFISSIDAIEKPFSYVLMDIWGVLHDGVQAYPGALEALGYLKKKDIPVFLFTNAPRRKGPIRYLLDGLGVSSDLYTDIFSSGIQVEEMLRFNYAGKKFLHFVHRSHTIWPETCEQTEDPQEADFILLTGPSDALNTLKDYEPIWELALEKKLPLLCANTDLYVIVGGKKTLCAGSLALIYEKKGGEVHWFGKPVPSFYHWVKEKISRPLSEGLAVGDSLRTDIQGAKNQGMTCLMVCKTGIHQESFLPNVSDQEAVKIIQNLAEEMGGGSPTYAMNALA